MKRAPMVVILLAASPAFAYVRSTNLNGMPIRWSSNDVHLETPKSSLPGMTNAETDAAIARAAAAWSTPECTGLRLVTTDWLGGAPQVANDMRATVIVRTDLWCDGTNCHEPGQLAVTTVFARAADGVIVDADIELNGVDHRWTNIPDSGVNPTPGAADLANVMTHELGHLLGLSDNCVTAAGATTPLDDSGHPAPVCATAPAALREATMFPDTSADDIRKRTLADDDTRGICAIYPKETVPPDAGSPDVAPNAGLPDAGNSVSDGAVIPPPATSTSGKGGCAMGGGNPASSLVLLLALFTLNCSRGTSTRRCRRRCRSAAWCTSRCR